MRLKNGWWNWDMCSGSCFKNTNCSNQSEKYAYKHSAPLKGQSVLCPSHKCYGCHKISSAAKLSNLRLFRRCTILRRLQPTWSHMLRHRTVPLRNSWRIISWLDSLVVKASEWWLSDYKFEPRPPCSRVTTLGKLFTPMCLCHQAV